jgi:hypothetical protein
MFVSYNMFPCSGYIYKINWIRFWPFDSLNFSFNTNPKGAWPFRIGKIIASFHANEKPF